MPKKNANIYTHDILKEDKKRQSNFELLRIVSMLLIVIFHFSDKGGLANITDPLSNKFFGEFINIGGKLGVNLFVLISGYFLIDSKFKFKKILKIIFEVWMYSVGITLVCYMLNVGNLSTKTLLKSLLPISYNQYWFATTYIGLYLLFPIINKVINNIDKQKHKTILILLGIMLSIIPTFIPKATPFNSSLIWFIYLYTIAVYIKKYDIKLMNNNKRNLIIIIALVFLMFGFSVFTTIVGIKINIFNSVILYFNSMNMLPMLILSIYVFMFFKNLNIKDSKIINTLAKSSFAVYLIHMNFTIKVYLYSDILKIQNFYDKNTLILISYVIITSIIIYLVCVLIDIIRIKLIEEPIFKIKKFDKYINKIDKAMEI